MTSCPVCALPNTALRDSCAFCQGLLLDHAPVLGRLVRNRGSQPRWNDELETGDLFTLSSGNRVMACARRDGNIWIVETGSGASLKLITVRDEAGYEIVLFDAMLNVVATLRALGRTLAPAALLFDAAETLMAVVRADGCGGLHVMAPDGNVLLFAGRSEADFGSLDLLLTDSGAARPLVVLFAAMVGLEAERIGPLHPTRS